MINPFKPHLRLFKRYDVWTGKYRWILQDRGKILSMGDEDWAKRIAKHFNIKVEDDGGYIT